MKYLYLSLICALEFQNLFPHEARDKPATQAGQQANNQVSTQISQLDKTQQKITVTIPLGPDELLYKNSFYVTVNNPKVTLSKPVTQNTTITRYDPSFKEPKEGYQKSVAFSFEAHNESAEANLPATIHAFFTTNKNKQPQEKIIEINFKNPEKTATQNSSKITAATVSEQTKSDAPEKPYTTAYAVADSNNSTEHVTSESNFSKLTKTIRDTAQRWKTYLSGLFTTTGSRLLRLLVALILGVLLSLTPCIYPMIPITVGVLQANQNKSMLGNFTVALAYTLGISCTFAAFGFVTAVSSHLFGELQNTGWIVLPLILLLIYLGLSMFGFYEMYIPKFMQSSTSTVQGGSLTSAFVFGAISGTVASPCLSPGLALILAHVAKIAQAGSLVNYLDGFLTLFVFGIGSSLPLLIIGTFSTSLNLLPKAGLWMVEVKKLLGLMLLAMAFYQLERFIPWFILSWIGVLCLLGFGIYYFIDIKPYDSPAIRRYKHIAGTLLIIGACLMAVHAYKAYYVRSEQPAIISQWPTDYAAARAQAEKENKKIFIDFTTQNCPMCTVLAKKMHDTPEIAQALKSFVLVQVDGTEADKEPFAHLQKIVQLRGFPTLAILDPKDEKLIKLWAGDIGQTELFVEELQRLK